MQMHPRELSLLGAAARRRCVAGLALALLLLAFSARVLAQQTRELATLYRSNNIEQLQRLHEKGEIRHPGWRAFVAALFIEDAEAAVQEMLAAYPRADDPNLERFIRERVALFYSSRGYYETARKILNDRPFIEKMVAMNQARTRREQVEPPVTSSGESDEAGTPQFGIQVGAFSTMENARRASRIYRRYYANTRILEKEKESGVLYIVVIGDYPTRAAAEEALPGINNQFQLNGYIIQY